MGGFEWDPDKAAANVVKHGIGFEDAALALLGAVVSDRSDRDGETRLRSICRLEDALIVVVWTPRLNAIRILSARLAKRDERKEYREALRRGAEGR
jgi:uncharacterized DUF497 family protein